MNESKFNFWNKIFGILVLLISGGVFIYTAQPTVAFWDCGEYAACSAILGIPHPPGNPLFIVVGRFITMLFSFIPSVAYRLNIFSAISAGFAIMVVYFISVKSIKLFMVKNKEFTVDNAIVTYLASFAGALFLAFSSTWWFNSVESEVYSSSMLIMLLETLFTLKWYEEKDDPKSVRFLYFVIYMAVLGVGIHLYTMMALPAIILFYVLVEKKALKDWKFLGVSFIIGYIMVAPKPFIWGAALLLAFLPFKVLGKTVLGKITSGIIAFSSLFLFITGRIPISLSDFSDGGFLLVTLIAVAVIFSLLTDSGKAEEGKGVRSYKGWSFLFAIIAVSALGYSSQAFIPLRAMAEPAINENDPQTWESFKGFIERKQYGDESMFKKMFHRQGSLINQFGTHPRMGFAGFFIKQFGDKTFKLGSKIKVNYLFLIPGLLGFLGLFAFGKKEKNVWVLIGALFILSSIGLTLYMNFSDGTRGVRLEVRDRDYFWTPAFMYFGNLIAMGIFILLKDIKKYVPRFGILSIASIIAILPFATLYANYDTHTRHGNYFPYDYAYNLLNSCEEGGILFTNGDNDTFPLWYLQEAEKVRTDVIVANLSLINTKWYIKELLRRGLPTTFSKQEIENIGPTRGIDKPTTIHLANADIDVTIPKKPYFMVQDRMVLNIVDANRWQRPIYFAITVGSSNYVGLDPYMQMEAMVYRVNNKIPEKKGNFRRSEELLNNVYQYRGLEEGSKVRLMEEDRKLVTNYAAMYIMLAQEMLSEYFKNNDKLAVINRNLNDSSVVAGYTSDELDSLTKLKEKLSVEQSVYKQQIKTILENGKRNISRSDMFDKYGPQFLSAIGENQTAISDLEKKLQVSPSAELQAKYLDLLIEQRKNNPNDDDIAYKTTKVARASIKKYPNDKMIAFLAAQFFEDMRFYPEALQEYTRLLKLTDSKEEQSIVSMKIEAVKKEMNKK